MLAKSRVLVIGGGGFIGRNLIAALIGQVAEIRSLDVAATPVRHGSVSHWQGSFLQAEVLREAMTGCDIVYHLAATAMPRESNLNPARDCQENVVGTLSVLDTATAQGVGRLIFSSSGGTVYGNTEQVPIPETHPTNPISGYGISKLACEKYLRLYDGRGERPLRTISLRIANPYGPFQNLQKAQGALTTFCYNAVNDLPIAIWGDGSVERDFVHVSDVARAMLSAATAPVSAREINIGSGRGHSLNEILDVIGKIEGRDIPRTYQPGRAFDVPRNFLDITDAEALLGWTPQVDLRSGIAELLAYFRAERENSPPPPV